MDDQDVEKTSSHAPNEDVGFEPIRGTSMPRRPLSRRTSRSRSRSVSRVRSQNGYSCDEDSEDTAAPPESEQEPAEKDPFEVGWDGGDNDPMCPRRFGHARKWLIVCIVSFASLCV
jgi:hypothetical protein